MPTSQSFLDEIAVDPPSSARLVARRHDDYPINTESLLQLLKRQVRVNRGFRLEHEGISCSEGVVTSRYNSGDKVRTFEGSLLVNAEGMFSAGRANHFTQNSSLIVRLAVRGTHNLSVWPAIIYASTIVVSRERYETESSRLLDDNGDISLLVGNT